jgi:hypothetical protein
MMSEIDKIINQSSRQELIEFLGDNSFELESAILLYRKPDGEYGFRKLDGSSNLALIAILRVMTKLFEREEVDSLEDEMESEDE